MLDVSFSDLRCRFQTGRSYVVSGIGRNRIYGYRNGVMCQLGDIERSEWIEMVRCHRLGRSWGIRPGICSAV